MENKDCCSDRKKAILEELLKGRELAKQLLHLLPHASKSNHIINPFTQDLVNNMLGLFTNSFLLLNSHHHYNYIPVTDSSSPFPKSEDHESCKSFRTRNGRGCYKRKRNIQTWIKDSPILVDDGHTWRKYGQNMTTNAKFLRNYYRCCHKYDQGCPAMKQVQRIREKTALYRTTYYGLHTCNKNNPFVPNYLDPSSPSDSSSVLLSFNNNTYNTDDSNSNTLPCLQHHRPFLLSSSSTQEKEHTQEDVPHDHVHHHVHAEQNLAVSKFEHVTVLY